MNNNIIIIIIIIIIMTIIVKIIIVIIIIIIIIEVHFYTLYCCFSWIICPFILMKTQNKFLLLKLYTTALPCGVLSSQLVAWAYTTIREPIRKLYQAMDSLQYFGFLRPILTKILITTPDVLQY